jgi:hypothetical protein
MSEMVVWSQSVPAERDLDIQMLTRTNMAGGWSGCYDGTCFADVVDCNNSTMSCPASWWRSREMDSRIGFGAAKQLSSSAVAQWGGPLT